MVFQNTFQTMPDREEAIAFYHLLFASLIPLLSTWDLNGVSEGTASLLFKGGKHTNGGGTGR